MLELEQRFTVGQGRLAGVRHQAADNALYQQQTGARHFLKMSANVRLIQEKYLTPAVRTSFAYSFNKHYTVLRV